MRRVGPWDEIAAAVERALRELGRIDILVSNAAAPPGKDRVPVVELTEEAWDEVLDTNLKGTYLVAKAVARAMIGQPGRGRIITMASDFGKVGQPERAAC